MHSPISFGPGTPLGHSPPSWARERQSNGANVAACYSNNDLEQKNQVTNVFFFFPWGSQSFGPNFAFFREALAIL